MKRPKKEDLVDTETEWGGGAKPGSWRWLAWVPVVCSPLIAAFGLAAWMEREEQRVDTKEKIQAAPMLTSAAIREDLETAERVAQAFLKESDSAKRLQWVRNAEDVKERLAEYPEEAHAGVGEIQRVLGHQGDAANPVTAFVVAFPSGNVRLLEVVGTPDGPRVDWDAYARYGTASWEDLLSGKAEQAVVRVFCEPSSERPEPFGDQGKWTCFRLSSPDLPQATLGFAEVGSVRERMMKQVILGTPNYRQHFVLEIVRFAGKDEPLFEIRRCMAVGWILGESAVEETWELGE
jgi:hypothetical protein